MLKLKLELASGNAGMSHAGMRPKPAFWRDKNMTFNWNRLKKGYGQIGFSQVMFILTQDKTNELWMDFVNSLLFLPLCMSLINHGRRRNLSSRQRNAFPNFASSIHYSTLTLYLSRSWVHSLEHGVEQVGGRNLYLHDWIKHGRKLIFNRKHSHRTNDPWNLI